MHIVYGLYGMKCGVYSVFLFCFESILQYILVVVSQSVRGYLATSIKEMSASHDNKNHRHFS